MQGDPLLGIVRGVLHLQKEDDKGNAAEQRAS